MLPVGGTDFLFSGYFRSFPAIGVNSEGLRCVEERATWAALFMLLSVVIMDSMLENGHKAWQGRTVIEVNCKHEDAIAQGHEDGRQRTPSGC